MKFVLLLLLLGFACAVAMAMLTRLLDSARQITSLRSDLSQNADLLQQQIKSLERSQAEFDARKAVHEAEQTAAEWDDKAK